MASLPPKISKVSTAAVVAHYDHDNRLDPTFELLLDVLAQRCERIVVVTTSELPLSDVPLNPAIITIRRPNVGYDFYSYRVGITEIMHRGGCDRLYLLNSSFLILDQERFQTTLLTMLAKLRDGLVVGISQSRQWGWHLQSYLLLLSGALLSSDWFRDWLGNIEPCNSKLATIISGELGFSRELQERRISVQTVFQPNGYELLRAYWQWLCWRGDASRFSRLWHLLSAPRSNQINLTHFAAFPLARQCGLVKAELLRSNPHALELGWIDTIVSPRCREMVDAFVARVKKNYTTSDGLTVLARQNSPLPTYRLIHSAPLARPGVRLAVILHIYYPELIDELVSFLKHIVEPFDLLVTTPHEAAVPAVFNGFAPIAQSIAVAVCENRGRDIGPFVALYRSRLMEAYEAVLKLHTKRSAYSPHGDHWRQSLYQELCGDFSNVKRSLALVRNHGVGIVGPHGYYLTHGRFWGANRECVERLLGVNGASPALARSALGFFGGSMFWFRPAALAALHQLSENLLVFEEEAGQQDGTMAHALERIFCVIARDAGYVVSSLPLDGEEIANTFTDNNRVPVL